MKYANDLIKNIKISNELSKYEKSYTRKELLYSDVEKLNIDKNKKLLSKLNIKKSSKGLIEMRYVLSSEKLIDKILKVDEKTANVYNSIVFTWNINEEISAEDLSLYDIDVLEKIISHIEHSSIIYKYQLHEIMKYSLARGFYNDSEFLIKIIDIVNKYNDTDYYVISGDKNLINKVEFAISNNLENLDYQSIAKLISDNFSDDKIRYSSYISNNGLNSIFNDSVNEIYKSFDSEKDLDKRIALLQEINLIVKENFNKLLYIFEKYNFNNKEINTFLYKISHGEVFDFEDIGVDEEVESLLSFIYPNFNPEKGLTIKDIQLYHYALKNGKKKFLKTLEEAKKVIKERLRTINHKHFYRILNLNSLTVENIIEIEKMNFKYPGLKLNKFYEKGLRNISFKELKFIISLIDAATDIYELLLDEKVDTRMMLTADLFNISENTLYENKEEIVDLIRQKSLSSRINNEYKRIKKCRNGKLNKEMWLKYFLIKDLENVKHQINNDLDVMFMVNYSKEIKQTHLQNLEEIKKYVYLNSDLYKDFIKALNASEEFIKENDEKIYEFFLSGMMLVFKKYYYSLSGSYAKNLIKITKAELSNQLKEIKFYDGDLAKEIGYDISDKQEELWKNNIKTKGQSYVVEEADDYETILTLGAIPVNTCMHYDGGSYNYCLLSNFDANKKVILGKSSDGSICGRAILRLTKISDTQAMYTSNSDNELAFRDVENLSECVDNYTKNEELVLFLERCYTSVNDVDNMHFDILKLAYEKAKQLGVRLMISTNYSSYDKVREFKKESQAISQSYIYISKSKNGQQYLDSFYGSTGNDAVGYISAKNHIMFLQEGMFNSLYEKEKEVQQQITV